VLVLLTSFLAVARVGADYEGEHLVTLEPYPRWLLRHALGLAARLTGLCVLPLIALAAIVVAGVVKPSSLVLAVLVNAPSLVAFAMFGLLARLLLREALLANLTMLGVLLVMTLAPLVCCLPSFCPPLATFFVIARPVSSRAMDLSAQLGIAVLVGLIPVVLAAAACAGLGWWRYTMLQKKKVEADERKLLRPCRHCGERIPPETTGTCPTCAEEDPFGE
jgi:hypothetical protein